MMWRWLKISEHARVDFQTGRTPMACKRHFKSTAKVFILYVTYSELTVVVPDEPTITLQTLIKHHSNTIRSQLSNLTETFREKETFFQRKKLKFAEDKKHLCIMPTNQELEARIFSYGPQVEALAPQWLKNQIREKIQSALEKYSSTQEWEAGKVTEHNHQESKHIHSSITWISNS